MGGPGLTRLSSSGLEEKRGLSERTWGEREAREGTPVSRLPPTPDVLGLAACRVPTCLAKAAMSSLKESEEQTSPPRAVPSPAPAPSRGEQVANSHFSKTRASSGKSGCLEGEEKPQEGRAGLFEMWSSWEETGGPEGRVGEREPE